MKAQLLGLALTLGTTCFLLWLREGIVSFGKRRRGPRTSEDAQASRSVLLDEDGGLRLGGGSADAVPAASPVQIEEFLAELRAKSVRPRRDEPDSNRTFRAWPQS